MRAVHLVLLGMLLVAAGFATQSRTAESSDWWCWDDPVLVVNGQAVRILAGVPATDGRLVRMAEITVVVPEGVEARLVASVSIWFPLSTRLVRAGAVGGDGTVLVTAILTVQASGALPIALRLQQAGGSQHTSYGTTSIPAISWLSISPRAAASPPVSPAEAGRPK